MTTDTADHGHARRKSDRAGSEPAVDSDGTPVPPTDGPRAADEITLETDPSETALDAEDYDGTPDGASESDASEADESDDPASTPIVPPTNQLTRGRRRADGGIRTVRGTAADRSFRSTHPPRRRRTDEPIDTDSMRRRPARQRSQRGQLGWIATTVVLMLMLGGSVALDWYLWNTTEQWEERSGALTEINYDLGERLSAEQQTTLQLKSEIDLLTQQLATSNQKVTALSAEKASAVDESATYLQEIDGLEEDVSTASGVANALHRCVDGQQELVSYLSDAENYEAEELTDFSESVRALCAEAESANERFQRSLNQ